MKRAVITGYGVVSALGPNKAALAEAIATGRSGVRAVTLFDTTNCHCHTAAQVDIDNGDISRADSFLAQATNEALDDAGLPKNLARLAVFQGTAHGPLDRWEHGDRACRGLPIHLGEHLWSSLAEQVSVTTLTNACVASTWAAGLALNAIRQGKTELALVAGAESLTEFLFRGFDALRSLTSTHCRPFDRYRDGLVLGEGAAVLVLEEMTAAHRRGAPIRMELAGFGTAADAHHLTAPDVSGKGAAMALKLALKDASEIHEIDYINLHGTGTPRNDRMEINAIQRVFGKELATIHMSGTKAMTGHASGAAGVMELAICLTAQTNDLIPYTVGLEQPDTKFPECDLVAGEPRRKHCRILINTNSAFGGNNAAIVLRECP
uniref:3-oxoacyl-[acyl-carrier-protein] synthase II n=1 Tax=Candidatus Kentrum sp. FM TaxID=2126340 RepID=A0A450VRY3_9GAMM|nr:MAG: 3-oxoacyl-[acyl-carrier-protein] synthase II [Candidatus Kentron sp. FM]VFJ47323.1 MAG: 3-oxoacyl-[acyl-carrier-protein] synthase II [Candidatus Kentron sp. FM]VFK07553.1 MAG: 3-oxoacyl-[acyl-carrier-protein] synthase II [Candidatus Kentron sp. FM]